MYLCIERIPLTCAELASQQTVLGMVYLGGFKRVNELTLVWDRLLFLHKASRRSRPQKAFSLFLPPEQKYVERFHLFCATFICAPIFRNPKALLSPEQLYSSSRKAPDFTTPRKNLPRVQRSVTGFRTFRAVGMAFPQSHPVRPKHIRCNQGF